MAMDVSEQTLQTSGSVNYSKNQDLLALGPIED
jgi:hypothetical protein